MQDLNIVVISTDWRFLRAFLTQRSRLTAVVQISWGDELPRASRLAPLKSALGRGEEGVWKTLAALRIPLHRVTAAECGQVLPELLKRLQADVAVSYKNPMFPPELVAAPRLGVVNLHPSLLPAYRGALPHLWMARDFCLDGGVTAHLMTAKADRGDILGQTPYRIPEGAGEDEIEHAVVIERGVPLLVDCLARMAAGQTTGTPQPKKSPTAYARFRDDAGAWKMIDWEAWSLRHLAHFLRQRPFWAHRLPPRRGWRRGVEWAIGDAVTAHSVRTPGTITPTRTGYRIAHREGYVTIRPRLSVRRLAGTLLRRPQR